MELKENCDRLGGKVVGNTCVITEFHNPAPQESLYEKARGVLATEFRRDYPRVSFGQIERAIDDVLWRIDVGAATGFDYLRSKVKERLGR